MKYYFVNIYLNPGIRGSFAEIGVSFKVMQEKRDPLVPQRHQVFVDVGGKVLHECQDVRPASLDERNWRQHDQSGEHDLRSGDVDKIGIVNFVVRWIGIALFLCLDDKNARH